MLIEEFYRLGRALLAVDGVDFEVQAGEVTDRGLVMVILKPQWLGE